ncbi:MAG: hemolysin family protein [Actinobacteria bacterium]|jgi:CBS domain containing-hemolysin-like protein|uniref:CBS domain containing-hemolysin-like protein n=1 Tax=Nocardioides marinus TaxID=374514 RepID=A0A7Z0C270_9ACTN|nr:hemolysin family protein [Nocardioides marinus]MBU2073183.1 hemolysin family protein [Actinomycetota bacterium]MBU2111806.1 hemolysin family protein [Actinomycetota bacterium]NYI09728.1 CBS domain containing-hemolysin-like protein [Nocardioides marinus]
MSAGDVWLLVTVALLVMLAGGFSAADAALSSFSQARAGELAAEERAGSKRLLHLLEDAPRYLNTALLLRLACEVTAIVLATLLVRERFLESWAVTVTVTVAVMLVLSFVVIGVAPRTLGRQHSESVALFSAGPLTWVTRVLGPVPRVLILLGNAITPGRGFSDGPFSTETELRELVDLAEASSLIESEERRMIHSVFDLSDTTAREVMVPRGDVVFVERHKNLRQTLSLFLRSGFSRVPVIEDNLDHVVGVAYLKDLVRRDFEEPDAEFTERIESHMREPYWVPESKPVDDLLREMQARRQHVAIVVDEYGGTAGLITIEDILEEIVGEISDEYDGDEVHAHLVTEGLYRVSSRYPVDDLEDLFGFDVEEEDVDSVGGLMAKHLGLVPIPGSMVEAHGLRFVAESAAGRRNKIDTVLITVVEHDEEEDEDE